MKLLNYVKSCVIPLYYQIIKGDYMCGNYNDLGTRLKYIRSSRNVSQEFLANTLGIDRTTISGYESGRRLPDLYTLWRLADLFEVSLDDLVGRT